ncbi:hypothetical protein [Vibrio diazotrophicus]|uniref:hypothetical protein n=1 Tax=Vibrio diazotrophicus TaxID=685 RepID=UPI000C9DCDDC|nr:hypothetical protein [Vibrio diazotrophicus]
MKSKSQINIEQLKSSFMGKRTYRAKNDIYTFDIFDNAWQISTKKIVDVTWVDDMGYDLDTYISIRVLMAESVSKLSVNTIRWSFRTIKTLGNDLSLAAFTIKWLSLSSTYKLQASKVFAFAVDKAGLTKFQEIYEYIDKHREKTLRYNKILDPEKGVYSETEFQSIKENMRLETDRQVALVNDEYYGSRKLLGFSSLIACQLMVALMRRPTQLAQLKWIDFLPVGERFLDHRKTDVEPVPSWEYSFSDVECLHARTFKGKNGEFRTLAERNSQRLEPELSQLVLLYRKQYEFVLQNALDGNKIEITKDELRQTILACPIFPEEALFTCDFKNKENFLKSLSVTSDSFHKGSNGLQGAIRMLSTNLNLKSDRIEGLLLGNNRLRHTVLSQGALQGLTAPYLAKITGVTVQSVSSYIDLSFESRIFINKAFAEKEVLRKFGNVSVSNLLKKDEFRVVNEFEEELGVKNNPANCASCKSKLGVPMGCYPCDNFTAKEDANHQQYLDKAVAKYEVNKEQGNKIALRKLREIIIYIRATIKVCEERRQLKLSKGIENE